MHISGPGIAFARAIRESQLEGYLQVCSHRGILATFPWVSYSSLGTKLISFLSLLSLNSAFDRLLFRTRISAPRLRILSSNSLPSQAQPTSTRLPYLTICHRFLRLMPYRSRDSDPFRPLSTSIHCLMQSTVRRSYQELRLWISRQGALAWSCHQVIDTRPSMASQTIKNQSMVAVWLVTHHR